MMGGFALHDADKSFLRVLDERTLEELDKAGEIEWPTITEKEIQDRSKADIFSKGIVLVQTTWFVIQCISRFATKLAVTELEVVTLAFALLNVITYWLWWDKPSDVRCAVPVYLKSVEVSSNSKITKARWQRDTRTSLSTKEDGVLASFRCSIERRYDKHGLLFAVLYTFLWVPMKAIFGPGFLITQRASNLIPDDDITRVPTFYTPTAESRVVFGSRRSVWTLMIITALFGAIHFIPWSSNFPAATERWLWRVSTILITGGPLFTLFLIMMCNCVSDPILQSVFKTSGGVMFIILIPVYIISRTILLIIPLTVLRSLPPTALLELKWSEFFPHI